jgi:hypothetical protein
MTSCSVPNCANEGRYRAPEHSQDTYLCSCHRTKECKDVLNQHCLTPECPYLASYGPKGQSGFQVPLHCFYHYKLDEEVRIVVAKCYHSDCALNASWGLPARCPWSCQRHSSPDMVNVVYTTECKFPKCISRAIYAQQGNVTIATRCSEHRQEGMIIPAKVERRQKKSATLEPKVSIAKPSKPKVARVSHKKAKVPKEPRVPSGPRCQAPTCNRRSEFGHPRESGELHKEDARFCARHKLPGMCNLTVHTCDAPECYQRARYYVPQRPGVFCERHCGALKLRKQECAEFVKQMTGSCALSGAKGVH